MKFTKASSLRGEITVPGDKSISHRSVMLGSLAEGKTTITNFLYADDCISTIECFRQMGIEIDDNKETKTVVIEGKGLNGLKKPAQTLDVGNSGTTIRLMTGLLAGQNFDATITGDDSIQSRPMDRVIIPLEKMGAHIESTENGCAPLNIKGDSELKGIHYHSPVASAQIKSCALLAGLYAEGETSVTEPALSRNHTELMLESFGAEVKTAGLSATVSPNPKLIGRQVDVPGDISSAAFFIVAGLIIPGSEIRINNVGINPTRDGIVKVCQAMGADISLENKRESGKEPVADIIVKHSQLKGITIDGDIIPTLIDEIPIISVMASVAKGQTIIKDAAELKVKESNRIDLMVDQLALMGVDIEATDDGMIINGGDINNLKGVNIESELDHRIAMSFAIAGLLAEGETSIEGFQCVNISYPEFNDDLNSLIKH